MEKINQKRYKIAKFREKFQKKNLIYEGMAANQYIFYPKTAQKIYDVGFFGQHYGKREYWLNTIKKY